MSLAALALRTCAFMALYGQTQAEKRVYDSAVAALDDLVKDVPQPFITVSVDEATADKAHPNGCDLLGSVDRMILVLDFAVGQAVKFDGGAGEVVIPFTDAGLEWTLDLMSYQATQRLLYDPVWGVGGLFGRFALRIYTVQRVRGANADGGRFAARQMAFDLEPVGDPIIGTPPETGSVWFDFLAALRAIDASADPELGAFADLADAIEEIMSGPTGLLDWEKQAALLGITRAGASAIGFGPVADLVTPDVPTVETVSAFGNPIDEEFADQVGDI